MPLDLRFSSVATAATSLGQITGIIGLVLFSINLIISGRFKFIDKIFYGLPSAYNFHQKLGALSFCLLLFHPLFLVVKYVQLSLRLAADFFIPSFQNVPLLLGIGSLGLMIALMVITFYIKIKYQRWKISHKFMVVVFILAVAHAFLATSDISRDYLLRYYIMVFVVFGLISGFYRAFLSKFVNRNYRYKVVSVKKLNLNVVEIEFQAVGEPMKFNPGQFVFVSFIGRGISSEVHPFSISSSPQEGTLKLVIKSLGDFTDKLKSLEVGTAASIEGPFGRFSYGNVANRRQIWLAGGIGIAPFLSMIKDPGVKDYEVDLYYCVKNSEEAVLSDDLLKISSGYNKFRVIIWRSDESGFMDAAAVSRLSGSLAGKDILVCGPPAFIRSLTKQFVALGVNKNNIHSELFNFL